MSNVHCLRGCILGLGMCIPLLAIPRPNIILVMADDQGWGDMAYNGHPLLKTPYFDAAANSGLRFDRFYAAAPVCSPTRASVLTGRHPNRMGVFKWGYPMRPQEWTIAEALKDSGYHTSHFGKWHLGSVRSGSPANPGRNGFEYWFSAPNFFDNDPILCRNGTAVPTKGESSIVTADAALEWIRTHANSDQPFFAVVWFGSPHAPHQAIDQDRAHYSDQPERLQHFLGEVTGMDRAFGKLRAGIKSLGIQQNTLLWYCSDNGALPRVGSTGGHRGNKGTVYEGGLLVPAFVEWPEKIKVPRSTNVRCNTCDILPTVLQIAGIGSDSTRPIDGVSLWRLIQGKRFQRKKPMGFWDYRIQGLPVRSAKLMSDLWTAQQNGQELEPNLHSKNAAELPHPKTATDQFPGHAAWIEGDWKLHRIADKQQNVKWKLYDLAKDRSESNDLIQTESGRADKMKTELDGWLKSVVMSLNGEDY